MVKYENIRWAEVIKKKARCLDGFDLGEVRQIDPDFIVTAKGVFKRESYCLPAGAVKLFDGSELWFAITEEDAEKEFKVCESPEKEAGNRLSSAMPWSSQELPLHRRQTADPCSFCVLVNGLMRAGAIKHSDYAIVRRHAILAHGVSPSSLVRGILP
jgi:hypothetical protein